MITAVADMHTIVRYLASDPRLSSPARTFIDSTALYLEVPIISRDSKIQQSKLEVIW
jgi:hypothetical protein